MISTLQSLTSYYRGEPENLALYNFMFGDTAEVYKEQSNQNCE
jgi:hypothetical protein